MFDSLKKYKYVLIVLVVAVGGFYAYQRFGSDVTASPLLTSTDTSGGTAAGEKIVQLLTEVHKIRFNTGLLSSTAFKSLVDFTEKIQPEAIGRHDPFQPIGIGSDIQGVTAQPTSADQEVK